MNKQVMWMLAPVGNLSWTVSEVGEIKRAVAVTNKVDFNGLLDAIVDAAREKRLRITQVTALPGDRGLLFVLDPEPEPIKHRIV